MARSDKKSETKNEASADAPTAAEAAGSPATQTPMNTPVPEGAAQLIVNGQYVKDLSFENPNILRMMQTTAAQPDVTIDLGVNVQGVTDESYEVVLTVKVETKREGISGFIVELAYAGLFTLRGWQADQVEPLLFVEGPKLLFPFARMIISNLTRDGGYPPLNLNPIDFAQLYRRRLQQQAAQAGGTRSNAVN
jgi:preprotein translocase subunit SecB